MTPEKIGKYKIVGKLGQGAMGEVFRGHDPVLNRDVAIKRISSGLDADETLRKRFEREAQAVAHLNHPHIITVYELGFEGDQMFMAMELLEGTDLKHVMAQKKLALGDKLGLMEQICEGLAFAHARDLVHRDLKPANIHILPGGKVKIMDFGLARMSGSDMTSTGTVMGTPHYMSPEQVRGQKADARSDVFALGCVFYELLSGRKPFDAESMHGVLFKVMQEEPTPLAEAAPDVPPMLVQLVEKSLAKDPAERFQSAADLLAALRRVRQAAASGRAHERVPDLERTSVTVAPRTAVTRPAARPGESRSHSHSRIAPPPDHGRRNLMIGLAAGVATVAIGAVVVTALRREPSRPAADPGVVKLMGEAVATRVQLARRRLDAGDFKAATESATSALELSDGNPQLAEGNAEARAVLSEAAERGKAAEAAQAALEQAQSGKGDAAAAAFALMRAAPSSPAAEKAARAAGAAFRPRADEARTLAAEARAAAEKAGAAASSTFSEGDALEKQGQRVIDSDAVQATQRLLEARIRYERAARGRKSS
jgi:serine/threonine-protein kinase